MLYETITVRNWGEALGKSQKHKQMDTGSF